MSLSVQERIPPVRGLVPLCNARGAHYRDIDLRRWLRVTRYAFGTEKIDLLAPGDAVSGIEPYLAEARSLDAALSLRTDCSSPPPDLASLRAGGLFDVFLCPADPRAPGLSTWLDAAQTSGLAVRLQMPVCRAASLDADTFAADLAAKGVVAVNLTATDPFSILTPCRDAHESRNALEHAKAFVQHLPALGIEVNLIGLPLCIGGKECLSFALNSRQFFLDHQQYDAQSYELAARLWKSAPWRAGVALQMLLGRYTSFDNPIDRKLLPWLLEHPWLRARVWAVHKLTRHIRLHRSDRPADSGALASDAAGFRAAKPRGPCTRCAFVRICDHETPSFRRMFPGLAVEAQPGEAVAWSLHFIKDQPKYYDAVDGSRAASLVFSDELVQEAQQVLMNHAPTEERDSYSYALDGQWCHQVQGGVRWHGFTNTEKLSTPLARLEPPCTVAVAIGGGIAEYIGFSFGRHAKVLCPMEAYAHELALHVREDGSYVLLRDGAPVRPAQFEGFHYVPRRLAGVLEPRISIWNIDGTIVTQRVRLWTGMVRAESDLARIKYSVLIVCARYARRFEAVLQSILHQEGFDLRQVEVLAAYVPGADPTEDILDSVEKAHPELRIVRSPFPEQDAHQKGFMINETFGLASGEWVVLLDADILLPPGMFAKLDQVAENAYFIAPDGRKMLPPDITARILLGEIAPWKEWDALLSGPGEFRRREVDGVPIGYCQIVRRTCTEKIRYDEYGHFEGADWKFGMDMRERFGKEVRLDGMPVLHLDHGGSQWYGTRKQF